MKTKKKVFAGSAYLVAVLTVSGGLLVANLFAQRGRPTYDYSRDDETLVVVMKREHGMIGNPDPTPLLRIYGSGRVHVHFPQYMKRAGDYFLYLTEQEMTALLSGCVDRGLMEFDAPAVKTARHDVRRERLQSTLQQGAPVVMTERQDETTTVIEFTFDRYQGAGPDEPIRTFSKKIAWPDLEHDAREFPQVGAILDLAAAAAELSRLTEREDLLKGSN